MAVAPLTVNFRRAEMVDFTKPFLSLGISVLFKIPANNQPELFSSLKPLPIQIWLCIVFCISMYASLIFLSFLIHISHKNSS